MIRFRRASKNVSWGKGVFRGFGEHPLFAEDWRLENNASSRRRHGGLEAEPPGLKNCVTFLAKITEF